MKTCAEFDHKKLNVICKYQVSKLKKGISMAT